jgi:hypothetical protein
MRLLSCRAAASFNNLHEAELLRGCACSFAKKACGIFSLVTGAAYLAPRYAYRWRAMSVKIILYR